MPKRSKRKPPAEQPSPRAGGASKASGAAREQDSDQTPGAIATQAADNSAELQPDRSDSGPGAAADNPALPLPGFDGRVVPRVVSLIMLVAIVLLVTAMFFRVMLQFVAPLFLAGVLVVVFEPLHKWVLSRFTKKPQWAALMTTTLVAGIVLIPITWLGLNALVELTAVLQPFIDQTEGQTARQAAAAPAEPGPALSGPALAGPALSGAELGDPSGAAAGVAAAGGEDPAAHPVSDVIDKLKEEYGPSIEWYEATFGADFEAQALALATQAGETVLSTGVHTLISAVGFFFGLGIMAFAMYYFLADGPAMVEALMKLSPLDDDYERELLEKFAEVSRAVVVATLLSAAAQGLMAGVGYYFALDGGPIFLLTAVTMLMAIVPFVGATIVWVPVVAWVFFYQGDTAWAVGLLLWCAIAVSNIDNVIKPYILHGQSNLHPLLALLSVLGGVSVLGPVGILVGPMLVAFLQALLNMLRKELEALKGEPPPLQPAA
ncbi:MAG: AI-2E family transporter [Planctomycetota bacterium]